MCPGKTALYNAMMTLADVYSCRYIAPSVYVATSIIMLVVLFTVAMHLCGFFLLDPRICTEKCLLRT